MTTKFRVACITLVLAGCAGTQHFDAVERATGLSPQGYGAAEYDIWGPMGNAGQARVWAVGAYEATVGGSEMTVVEVVLDLENNGPEPMVLSELRLDRVDVGRARIEDLAPMRVDGDGTVPPGGEQRVRAYFAIPLRVDPEDIGDFRVRWAVRQGERTYAQRTPFLQAPDYYYSPYYYDPFWADPFYARLW